MIKSFYIYFLFFILFAGCKTNDVVHTHGLSYLEKREKLILVNKTNKNDAIKILGHPATKGMTNDNLWIYIERATKSGKLLKIGRRQLTKNNVLVLEFDNYGKLYSKKFYDKENMNQLAFAEGITENEIKKENFVYSFLSSIRTKMESRRK
tara:strand:+ start:324 stop:776 length:453 start_codon:yes stop_codon:yes gene_type:complete